MSRDRHRRTAFDRAAQVYDQIRPGPPEALVEDIVRLSGLPAGGRILEIGCGTGQATLPFARRGYRMLCLDLGPHLAALAAEKCRPYPKVEVRASSFEDWPPGDERFDLVFSANAFHWVPPQVGCAKSAAVLKDSGALAVSYDAHPAPHEGFFPAVNRAYQEHAPELANPPETYTPEGTRRFHERVAAGAEKLRAAGLFAEVVVRTYPWSRDYDAGQYLKLLGTCSDHLGLPEKTRRRLFEGIAEVIARFGGRVTKPYLTVLYLALKRPAGRAPGA